MSFLINPYRYAPTGPALDDATWSTPSGNWSVPTAGQISKVGGTGSGSEVSTAQSAQDDAFEQFTFKWVSGLAYTWVGISTLDYISAGSYDETSVNYGFQLNNTNSTVTAIVDGSGAGSASHTVITDTEFKLQYSGGDLNWYIDDVTFRSPLTVDLSSAGLQYLFTNNNRYNSNTVTVSGTWG